MAAQVEQPPPGQALAPREAGLRLTTSEEAELDCSLALGQLDITTEQLSLAGIEKEIEAFGDSEVLRAILDQGAAGGWAGGGGGWRQRRASGRVCAALHWHAVLHAYSGW
jgi:hypothetical protein